MDQRDADSDEPTGDRVLTGEQAGRLLTDALANDGATLHDWEVRSVHHRGSSSVSVVYEVALVDGRGQRRDRLYVGHVSRRPVPAGATELDADGIRVHLWPFPRDPYLPGLSAAVNRAEAARLLRRLDLAPDDAGPAIRTRSYRPTRRAVVELRPTPGAPPLAYVKLLGGRDPDQVQGRARRLVAVHRRLLAAGPVPPVLEHDLDAGRVVLRALPGDSLRSVLRSGGRLPDARGLRDLVAGLRDVDELPAGGDPDGYADASRHVARLRHRLPERAEDLERIAAVAATVAGPRGTVHGDLHDGQLLVTDGTVTGVLDVDGAGTGFVAHDLGRLLAHLEASALAAPGVADRVTDYVDRVGRAVGDLAPSRDVAAAAAGAWLGLATGPLRVASPRWRSEAVQRIVRALAWATRAG